MQRMKRFLNPALLAAAAALLATTLLLPINARQAHAAGTQDAIDDFVAAINSGDGAAAAAAFTDDGTFFDLQPTGSFGAVGGAAMKVAFSEITNTHVKLVEASTSGNVFRGVGAITDDDSEAAGITRYLQTVTAVVRDGKIASFELTYDLTDAETAAYLDYINQPDDDDDDDGPPPGAFEFAMAPGRDGAQTGSTAFFDFDEEGVVFVGVDVTPGPDGVVQPAQLVAGDCPGLGAVVSTLAPPIVGSSFTIVSMSMSALQAGDFAVTVAGSGDTPNRLVSCGETESAELLGGEEPAAPAVPTTPPPPTGVITAPSTGTGSDAGSGTSLWLLASIVLAGITLAAAGTTLRTTRRTN